MRILFLHGWHSVPGGVKPKYLEDHGCEVINPALPDDDFVAAVSIAQSEFDRHQPQVVIGSSRGGAIAMNLKIGDKKLVLLCPAWKNWGTVTHVSSDTIILHSRADDVIPFADSEELLANSGLPPESLVEVGSDHRLADESALSVMLWVCNLLASGEQLPVLEHEQRSISDSSRHGQASSQKEASYLCDACGEEIIIPLDVSEGSSQTYVEDCPVCCRANTIYVQIDENGDGKIWAEPEQDYD